MTPAPEIVPDDLQATDPAGRTRRRYTPGLTDGLGERVLLFDPATATSLELLRFRRDFSEQPGFEAELRRTVDQLARFHHPSFAAIRSVERLGAGEGLALVSHHVPGRRLSEILAKARGPVYAFELVRSLAPALTALHELVPGVAHGLLTPERIAVTREGRLVLLEHVAGPALAALQLPSRRLRSELGLVTPTLDGPAEISQRTDVVQFGLLALSLLLGRRVEPADYPAHLAPVLDEAVGGDPDSLRLRPWLEDALQLSPRPFLTARDAYEAFRKLADEESGSRGTVALVSLRAPFAEASMDAPAGVSVPPVEVRVPVAPVQAARVVGGAQVSPAPPPPTRSEREHEPEERREEQASDVAAPPVPPRRWATVALGGVALAEAAVIALLLYAWPPDGTPVVIMSPFAADLPSSPSPTGPMAPAASAFPAADLSAGPAGLLPAGASPAPQPAAPALPVNAPEADRPVAERAAATPARFGGLSFTAPFELQVFEAGRLVGSTAGPIAMAEGTHSVEVVNEPLGFRAAHTVDVRSGQMTTIAVRPPDGRLSVNAVPWASVSINGQTIGDTPLANVTVPVGQHDVVFRHPQLGEQRQTVAVRAEGLTRVSVNMQQ